MAEINKQQLLNLVRLQLESWHAAGLTHFAGGLPDELFSSKQLLDEPASRGEPRAQYGAASQAISRTLHTGASQSATGAPRFNELGKPPQSVTPHSEPDVPSSLSPMRASPFKVIEPEIDMPKRTLSRSARVAELAAIAEEVSCCVRCKELACTRTQTVFGVGDPQARLVFLGEAPGADEDAQGEPFVGRAGQLLNNIIAACKLRREDVYIMNTIKCRPPGNRNPDPTEMANCREYFDRQLAILQPEFICCLGAVATRAIFENPGPLGKLRGKFFDFRGARVMVTYHPAYLLRNPPAKKDTWEDMKFLLKEMGVAL